MHTLMTTPDTNLCTVCHARFRRDDSIGTLAGGLVVHSRCLPKTPHFTDEELEDEEES
jgi:hypothetical protein